MIDRGKEREKKVVTAICKVFGSKLPEWMRIKTQFTTNEKCLSLLLWFRKNFMQIDSQFFEFSVHSLTREIV